MEKQPNTNADSQNLDEAKKHKKTLKQRCIETGAIPFADFKKEWMRQLDKALKEFEKNGEFNKS